MGQRVIIVGGGVIGAAAAFRLAATGAKVTVIDAGGGATSASFGWINASFYHGEDHFRLRLAGMHAYERLARDLNVPVARCGCLSWEFSGAVLDETFAELTALAYPVSILDAEAVRELEPRLANVPERTLYFPAEQAAEPSELVRALLMASGAQIVTGVRVTGLATRGDQITGVITQTGVLNADEVLVVAGTGTSGIVAEVGVAIPMLDRPAYVLETRPVDPILSHILATKAGEVRQRPDGVLVMPTSVSHQSDGTERLTMSPPEAAASALARLRSVFPDQDLDWARVSRAERPVPGDQLPVVGRVRQGLSVAVMHSGLTLAAVMGEMLAQEISHGPTNETQSLLSSFRPERFV